MSRAPLLLRLGLALGLVGLLPVAFSAVRLIGLNQQAMTNQVESTHGLAARTAAESIGEFLASRISLAESVAHHQDLGDPRSSAARQLLSRDLQAWASLGILAIAIVNPEGEEVIRAQLADDGSRLRADRALALAVGEPVELLADSETPTLRLQSALAGADGLIWLVCDGQPLSDLLDAYELGQQALMVVADRSGVLVGPPNALAAFPAEMIEPAFSPWISGVKPEFRERLSGREFIGSFSSVPYTSWAVISYQPAATAHEAARTMRRQAAWAIAGAVGLIAILLALAYASVVRPIREVAKAQRRLAGGRAAASGDEITQLKDAFQSLEQSLSDRDALDQVFLGRYQILELIGSGAMGTVFKAWDPKLERPVALKTIRLGRRLGLDQRSELIRQLLKEAVTVARFSHPNIVAVFDVEDRPEGAFVAMEYIDGMSLEGLLWRVGKLLPEEVVPLGAAVARGLSAAHAHDILHRDIKPANILLGRDGAIKVTDFGVAELISSMSPEADVVFGTPGYMSPESLQGRGHGKPSDLFALGVLLYFCATGRLPFDGKTVKDVIRKTIFGSVAPVRQLEPRISGELDGLIMALLARDPELRLADASLLADQLEKMSTDRGLRWNLSPEVLEKGYAAAAATEEAQFIPTTRLDDKTRVIPPPASS